MTKTINNNNIQYEFNVREDTSDLLVIKEILEEDAYRVPDIVEGTVVDIGANIGVFSIMCAKRGASKVYSLEPEPDNYRILVDNINTNGVADIIETMQVGLWHETTEKNMYIWQGDSIVCDLANDKNIAKAKIVSPGLTVIKMISIEELFNKIDGEISIMKIDCEWSEYDIIKNIPVAMLNRVKYITLEFHSTTVEEFGCMLARLSEVFNMHIIGSYNRGGMIYGERY